MQLGVRVVLGPILCLGSEVTAGSRGPPQPQKLTVELPVSKSNFSQPFLADALLSRCLCHKSHDSYNISREAAFVRLLCQGSCARQSLMRRSVGAGLRAISTHLLRATGQDVHAASTSEPRNTTAKRKPCPRHHSKLFFASKVNLIF